MSADCLVKNGTVVLPGEDVLRADVVIEDGTVVELGTNVGVSAEREIDASDLYVFPGLIDPHVHLDVLYPMEDQLHHETLSALKGGVTTLGAMCWSEEGNGLDETNREWEEAVPERSWTDFFPHLVVSDPQHLDQIQELYDRGITSFKVYTAGIEGFFEGSRDGYLLESARRIADCGEDAIMLVHCENDHINETELQRLKSESPETTSLELIRQSRPDIGEAEAIQRMGAIVEEVDTSIYFVHVSSKQGMEAARRVKSDRDRTYVESLCDHLSVTVDTSNELKGVQVPPLRTSASVDALWEAVEDGMLDVFSTDHVTFTRDDKNLDADNVWEVQPSYQKVEYHLPALLNYGYHQRGIELETILERTTRRPAEIFDLYPRKGTLLPGSDADLTLVDLEKTKTVDGEQSFSLGDFTVWDGERLTGWPVTTLKGGEVVFENGELQAEEPSGSFLRRPLDE